MNKTSYITNLLRRTAAAATETAAKTVGDFFISTQNLTLLFKTKEKPDEKTGNSVFWSKKSLPQTYDFMNSVLFSKICTEKPSSTSTSGIPFLCIHIISSCAFNLQFLLHAM
jgi:hypothetical protein